MQKGLDFIGVTTVFFCHDGQGKVLLAKRSQNARDEQGRWDIGGGGLEFGMKVEESLRREILEEYNAEVLSFEFLGYRDVHRTLDGKPTHWIGLDFRVLIDPANVRINEPHKFDALEWFELGSLPEPLHSQLPTFLRLYENKL
ncbi:MAG: NUDIX domain-containing protein [Candidatus Saccharibacteria bacterium]